MGKFVRYPVSAKERVNPLKYERKPSRLFNPPPLDVSVQLALSDNITAGGEATTNRLTGGTGSFVTGRRWDDENGADPLTITSGNFTEVEWSVIAGGVLTNGEVIQFRVVADGVPLDTYTVTPQWTLGTPPAPKSAPPPNRRRVKLAALMNF